MLNLYHSPIQYQPIDDEKYENKKDILKYKSTSLGFGSRFTYKTEKSDEINPGPIYQT